MSERLRPRDLAFLTGETPQTPAHNATIEIFEGGDPGFDYDRLLDLIRDRMSFVPRYRQRIKSVPGRLANPVWIDDEQFDLAYHVRRSALPRPGSPDQLCELVARIISRPLDRSRPLWEIYVVEGLTDDRVALLYKSHQALVDGVHTVDLGQLLLDLSPEPKVLEPDDWMPARPRQRGRLFLDAVRDSLTDRVTLVDTMRATTGVVLRAADETSKRVRAVAGALAGRRPEKTTAINGPLSQQRRVITIDTDLSDYQVVRREHGGTVNDVILATIAGGLRPWLMTRTESLGGVRQVRAVVPVSVIDEELEATSLGSMIAAHFVDLPVGEASPVVRLHQVSYSFQAHKETGRGVAANRLAGIAGFAPTTFHAIGSRVGGGGAASRLPAERHQRARPPDAAVRRRRADGRHLPGAAAPARAPAGDRGDVVRRQGVLRADRRPRLDPGRRAPRHLHPGGPGRAGRRVDQRAAARPAGPEEAAGQGREGRCREEARMKPR